MKKTWLVFLVISALAGVQAADAQQGQAVPLPPGFALAKMPAFSKWQIIFSYDDDKPATAGVAAPAATPGTGKEAAPPPRPRQVTVTRTDPVWHAVLVNTSGGTKECWGDGDFMYLKPTSESEAVPLFNNSQFSMSDSSRFVSNVQGGFPDLEWVSQKTYVGSQKGVFIFQEGGDDGAKAWIAADTCYPISWKKGKETRMFQILAPPTEALVLPADIAKISQISKRIHDNNNYAPPVRILPPPPS
jgi:hypothetical protein